MREGVTIHDVARRSNVSVSTVSNWLNGRHERMRSETSERIRRAITELKYSPNRVAQQLKTGHVPIIGLIVPSVANPFWGTFASSVEATALALGYQVLLCNGQRDLDRERRYAESLYSSGVRGIIFGSAMPSLEHLADLAARGLQIIVFDRQMQDVDHFASDSVAVDNLAGGRMAVDHLLALGHRCIGFISGPIRSVNRGDRLAGYGAALAAAGIELDQQLLWEGTAENTSADMEGAEVGRAGAHALLALPQRPSALFAINDMYALGAYAGARDLGLRVPEDVSIVGFDDILLAEIAEPPLTTIRQPIDELMRVAVERLVARIEGTRATAPEHFTLAAELVVRESTASIYGD